MLNKNKYYVCFFLLLSLLYLEQYLGTEEMGSVVKTTGRSSRQPRLDSQSTQDDSQPGYLMPSSDPLQHQDTIGTQTYR